MSKRFGVLLGSVLTMLPMAAAHASPCLPPGCGVPPPGATPELDSLILFGTGVAGIGSYAALRWRARRNREQ